ncbi:MAG TPA: LysM domain-containing protein, partial [Sneathiellales bacterium]|nr:LysM domain-containing protein [Sneathiellales bacterium]
MNYIYRRTRFAAVLLLAGFLTACEGIEIPEFSMPDFGFNTRTVPVIDRPLPDSRGIITYETYQVMIARTGDTITTMAERIGMSLAELARHNGLSTFYTPRVGEVLAIPHNVGGTVV